MESGKWFDFSLNYNDTTAGGLTYGISANITRAKNEVTELITDFYSASGDRIGPVSRTSVGEPIAYFYGRKCFRYFSV